MTVKKQERKPTTLVEQLQTDIQEYTSTEFQVAVGYDPISAVQSAVYELQQVQTPQKTPALSVVGGNSVVNAVRQMVTMGLYPDRKQGYFIAYGKTMTFMPSYMGYQMILKRDVGVKDVKAIVVYKGDEIKTHIVNGEERIVNGSHIRAKSPFEQGSTNLEDVVGAYAIATLRNGKEKHEIMNREQIDKAWANAKTKNVHQNFPDQMVKRTVLNRLAKGIINTSADDNARLEMISQAVYDADGYEYDDNNPLNVNMKDVKVTEVSPFDEETGEFYDSPEVSPEIITPKEKMKEALEDLNEEPIDITSEEDPF